MSLMKLHVLSTISNMALLFLSGVFFFWKCPFCQELNQKFATTCYRQQSFSLA